MSAEYKWLEDVREGDRLVVSFPSVGFRVVSVIRTTRTLIRTNYGDFCKRDGLSRGRGPWACIVRKESSCGHGEVS
jgi:hypothetical protein